MKFPSALSLLSSFFLASIGSTAAIPETNVTLSARDDAPYVACTPTGAGSCNLGFEGRILDGGVYWQYLRIYNYRCEVIGGIDSPQGDLRASRSNVPGNNEFIDVDSQLPYVVVVQTLSSSGYYNWIEFAYAGYHYGGNFACSDRNGINVCQHAFPC